MKLICKNAITEVYDDGVNYVTKDLTGQKEDIITSKEEWLSYPLALCLKWDFEPVDIDYLNKLSDSIGK